MVFAVVLIIGLTKDFALMSIPKSMFLFILCLVFPFIAVFHDWVGLFYIILFGLLFFLIFQYASSKHRKFYLAAALGSWGYYGLYCMVLVTGGA